MPLRRRLRSRRHVQLGRRDNALHRGLINQRSSRGPAAERHAAARELQETWWNGWKKNHGMKWQTVICGMDFQVLGPMSSRDYDLSALD